MDMATNIYPFIQEVDLRQELVDLFTGDEFVNKMRTFILRKSRKDSSDFKTKCHCYNEQTREGKSDCPDCSGEGYLWDEKIVVGHMWIPRNIEMANQSSYRSYAGKVGRLNNTKWILVVPYAIDVSEKDTIYLPKVDDELALVDVEPEEPPVLPVELPGLGDGEGVGDGEGLGLGFGGGIWAAIISSYICCPIT